jgi:hypothetical protein
MSGSATGPGSGTDDLKFKCGCAFPLGRCQSFNFAVFQNVLSLVDFTLEVFRGTP